MLDNAANNDKFMTCMKKETPLGLSVTLDIGRGPGANSVVGSPGEVSR